MTMYPKLVSPDGDGWVELDAVDWFRNGERCEKVVTGVWDTFHPVSTALFADGCSVDGNPSVRPLPGRFTSRPSLAALALLGDRVLCERNRIAIVKGMPDNGGAMVEFEDGRCGADWELQWGIPFTDIVARIVTAETEAARAAVHPDLAYPQENQ